jgi:hypothetical protein
VKRFLLLAFVVGTALPATAQTNDPLFRSWRLSREPNTSAGTALGGAITAGTGSVGDVMANPATLISLDKSEGQLQVRMSGSGRGAGSDRLVGSTSLGSAVLGWRLSPTVAVAGFLARPATRSITVDAPVQADGLSVGGTLVGSVTELGAAVSWRSTPWLQLGGSLAASRLMMDGSELREPPSGPADLRLDTTARATAPLACAGAVVRLRRNVRLAFRAATGAAWTAARSSASPAGGVVLADDLYEIRAPRTGAVGVRIEPTLRLALFGQVDYIRWRDVESGLAITEGAHARSQYALRDGWEPRAGLEVRSPHRTFSLVWRGGLYLQAPGLLRYTGTSPVDRALFVGERPRVVPSLGVAVVTTGGVTVDVGARLGEVTTVLAGGALRF